jgi:hypothetical protein
MISTHRNDFLGEKCPSLLDFKNLKNAKFLEHVPIGSQNNKYQQILKHFYVCIWSIAKIWLKLLVDDC